MFPNMGPSLDDLPWLNDDLRHAAYAEGWQAGIELAAKAACHWCKEDMELLHDESGYYHLYRGYIRNECRAAAIRALKEQTNA